MNSWKFVFKSLIYSTIGSFDVRPRRFWLVRPAIQIYMRRAENITGNTAGNLRRPQRLMCGNVTAYYIRTLNTPENTTTLHLIYHRCKIYPPIYQHHIHNLFERKDVRIPTKEYFVNILPCSKINLNFSLLFSFLSSKQP